MKNLENLEKKINSELTTKINSSNLIMFSDENFNISPLKKHISSSEHNFVKDLIKTEELNKKILSFEIRSKRKIILVSQKNFVIIHIKVGIKPRG